MLKRGKEGPGGKGVDNRQREVIPGAGGKRVGGTGNRPQEWRLRRGISKM